MTPVASGQLATSATAIYTAPTGQGQPPSLQANVTLANTSGTTTETVILTVTRASTGNTRRRAPRPILSPNESCEWTGISLAPGDSINASTTDANTVDYAVETTQTDIPSTFTIYDANGMPKSKGIQGIGVGTNNFTATTDPGSGSDNTQGYAAGSIWINTTLSRVWMCLSASTGAAVWLLDGIVPGTGADPSSMFTMFGGCAPAATLTPFSYFGEEGNLYRNIGNPIAGNGADTTDDILDGFVLPASAFDVAKRGLQLTFAGKFGATANNKKVRLWLNPNMSGQTVTNGVISGGTVTGAGSGVMAYDSTAQTGNAVGWSIMAQLFKYGSAGSNTQLFQLQPIYGATHGGVTAPSFLTLAENAAINVVITGSSSTTGAANDVVLNMSEANAMN